MVGLLFEEVIEIGRVFKTLTVAYLGDAPLRMLQQGLRFTGQPVKDVFGGGFAGGCSQGAVQMVELPYSQNSPSQPTGLSDDVHPNFLEKRPHLRLIQVHA